MTAPLVRPYAHRPVHVLGGDRVDPAKLTRELGQIELALRTPVAAVGGYFTLTDPQWGGDPTGRRDTGAVVRRILTTIASGATPVRAIYAPGGDYRFSRNFTLAGGDHNGVTLFGDGPSTRFFLSDVPDETNVESGWLCILDGSDATLRDVLVTRIQFDGNRAATTWADSSYGVIAAQDSVLENVVVQTCWAHDFRTSGLATYTGGVRFADCESYDNTSHGIGVSVSVTFTGVASIDGCRGHGNDGYGIDAGRGCRTDVTACEVWENVEGGMKYSTDTLYLSVNGLHTHHNVGPGFTETNNGNGAVVALDNIITHDNTGVGFRCTNAGSLAVGSILSYDNACLVSGVVQGSDITFGSSGALEYWSADQLVSLRSPARGVLVDGGTNAYQIGRCEVRNAEDGGFVDNSTGPILGSIGSLLLVNNNQAGTAGAAGSGAQFESTGSFFDIGRLVLTDDQGSPTQTGGLYASLGATVKVAAATFGTGITTPYYTASNGTTILHETTWGAIRSTSSSITADFNDGMILVDATGGARTITLKAATNMAGKVYVVKKVDASANTVTVDGNGAETVDGAATYVLTVQWQAVTVRCNGTAWFVE